MPGQFTQSSRFSRPADQEPALALLAGMVSDRGVRCQECPGCDAGYHLSERRHECASGNKYRLQTAESIHSSVFVYCMHCSAVPEEYCVLCKPCMRLRMRLACRLPYRGVRRPTARMVLLPVYCNLYTVLRMMSTE